MGEAIAGAALLGACAAVIITLVVNGTQRVIEYVKERKGRNNGRIL
jgi:hypothetical protein